MISFFIENFRFWLFILLFNEGEQNFSNNFILFLFICRDNTMIHEKIIGAFNERVITDLVVETWIIPTYFVCLAFQICSRNFIAYITFCLICMGEPPTCSLFNFVFYIISNYMRVYSSFSWIFLQTSSSIWAYSSCVEIIMFSQKFY
jgi:hypothetical protein